MLLRVACWAGVVLSLGLMVAISTYFQFTLPRLLTQWINDAVQQHNLVLNGSAGSPWQYRLLSEYLIQGLFNGLIAINNRNPYVYGFALFRGAQEFGIFTFGFLYFRKLGLSRLSSIVGLAIVCIAMLLGQLQTNWRLDTYTDVLLYLAAGVVILTGRYAFVVPVALLAALNRETGVLLPLMPLALLDTHSLRSAHNNRLYRIALIGMVGFVGIRIALQLALPSQALSTRVATDEFTDLFRVESPYVYVGLALGIVPLIASVALPTCNAVVRSLFWLVVPIWVAAHWWGSLATTPIPFLVPLVLVLVPGCLFLGEAVWRRSPVRRGGVVLASILGSTVDEVRSANWQTGAALAVVYVLGPLVAGLARLAYPFPLERLEGAVLQEVRRIGLGLPVYAAPSLAYVPTLYAPLYFYVSAWVSNLTGLSFLPLRLVSLLASIGSAVLMYMLASWDGRSRVAGVLAAALLLGTTQLELTDLNPVRVDALCLFLVLAALTTACAAQRRPRSALALSAVCGVLAGLAVLTKQTAGVAGVALLVLALPQPRARLLPLLAASAVTIVVAAAWLLASSDGWARFYLVDLPRNHSLQWNGLVSFWTDYLLPHLLVPLVFGGVFFVVRIARRDFSGVWFYALAAGGLIGMGWVSLLNPGGGTTSLLYAYAGIALLFGLGFQESLQLAQARTSGLRAIRISLFTIAAFSLAAVEYRTDSAVPLRANALAGRRLVEVMAALPGPVWAPDLGEFQLQAGKGDQAYPPMWKELLGDYGGKLLPEGTQFIHELDQALSSGQYGYLVVDPEGNEPRLKDYATRAGYVSAGPLFAKGDPFFLWQRGVASGGGAVTPAPDLYTRSPDGN